LIHLSMISALDASDIVLNVGPHVEIAHDCITEKQKHIDAGLQREAENLQIPQGPEDARPRTG